MLASSQAPAKDRMDNMARYRLRLSERTTILRWITLSLIAFIASKTTQALIITTASLPNDYRDVARLVTSAFDAPPETKDSTSIFDKVMWLVERPKSEQLNWQMYEENSRKMEGKKYSLLLAIEKEGTEMSTVGMAELGLGLGHDPEDFSAQLRPLPTIGVICVDAMTRGRGIGKALVEKCEDIVLQKWNHSAVMVDVEPENRCALSFFQSLGYVNVLDAQGNKAERMQTVSRRGVPQEKPHYILTKKLKGKN